MNIILQGREMNKRSRNTGRFSGITVRIIPIESVWEWFDQYKITYQTKPLCCDIVSLQRRFRIRKLKNTKNKIYSYRHQIKSSATVINCLHYEEHIRECSRLEHEIQLLAEKVQIVKDSPPFIKYYRLDWIDGHTRRLSGPLINSSKKVPTARGASIKWKRITVHNVVWEYTFEKSKQSGPVFDWSEVKRT